MLYKQTANCRAIARDLQLTLSDLQQTFHDKWQLAKQFLMLRMRGSMGR